MDRRPNRAALLHDAADKRQHAAHARKLADQINSTDARKGLLNYADELDEQARAFEDQATTSGEE